MTYLLPNAPDATGTPFAVLDQSEPDSLDFEALGNISRTFVISGGAVTTNSNSTTVNVSAASVVIDGNYYTIAANSALSLPTPTPTDKRFDLVVIRASSSTVAALAVIRGTENATNPTYPASRAITTATFDSTIHFDSNTDVILAAIYRPVAATVGSTHIVDKRAFGKTQLVSKQAAAVPTAGTATKGQLYYNNASAPSGSGSNLYVGASDGNWTELAANAPAAFIPIGGMIGWPTIGNLPSGYLSADGQSLTRTDYPTLFGTYASGALYGVADSTHFYIPDFNGSGGYVPKGTTTNTSGQSTSPGASVGSDTRSMTVGEMAVHQHLVDHTHTFGHTHTSGVLSNTAAPVSPATGTGDHGHAITMTPTTDSQVGLTGTYLRNGGTSFGAGGFGTMSYYGAGGTAIGASLVTINTSSPAGGTVTLQPFIVDAATLTAAASHTHTPITNGGIIGDHSHTLTSTGQPVGNATSSATMSNGTSGTGASTNTVGSGTAMSMVQASKYIRWIIRAL